MKILPFITIILMFACLTSQAQIDTILWQNCLGTEDGLNWTYAVEKTDNGYLFGIHLMKDGPGVSNFHGIADAWIINTDFYGNVLWERCYGGSAGDGPHKIIRITDSTFYLCNHSASNDGDVQNGRNGEFWIVKINDTGEILWENSYGGSQNGEEVRGAILMPDNGLLMMGRISSTGGDITVHYGYMDIWLCRIDSTGNILWQKTFGSPGQENAIKIKPTSRNTVLMVGCHDSAGGTIDCPDPGSEQANVWICEIDIMDGGILNQWCYGGSKWDQGYDIIEVGDGYVFAANTNSTDGDVSGFHGYEWTEYRDIWVVGIDYDGNLIWQKCLGGSFSEYPLYLTKTEDNGFIVIGNTWSLDGDVSGNHSAGTNHADIWVVKLDENGELLWEQCFGGLGTERFWGIHCVLKKDDYNYVLAANAQYLDQDVKCDLFPNNLEYNAWLLEIKDCSFYLPVAPAITSGPETLCSTTNPVSIYSIDIVQYAFGYEWRLEPENAGTVLYWDTLAEVTWNPQFEGLVTITARCTNECGYSGWSEPRLIMVYPCMGVNEQGGGEAGRRGCLEVWPNPASGIVDCRWSNFDGRGEVTLVIYDIFGRTILSLPCLGEGQGGGWRSWQIDVSSLPMGIYLAVVRDEKGFLSSAKFIVAR